MTAIHPCFRKGRNEWEAECLVCKPETWYGGFKITSHF